MTKRTVFLIAALLFLVVPGAAHAATTIAAAAMRTGMTTRFLGSTSDEPPADPASVEGKDFLAANR